MNNILNKAIAFVLNRNRHAINTHAAGRSGEIMHLVKDLVPKFILGSGGISRLHIGQSQH